MYRAIAASVFFVLAWAAPVAAHAYVGPGAGIAVATTALALLVSIVLVVVGVLLWPLRFLIRFVRKKRAPYPARIRRAVLIGLDGLDPQLTRRFMAEGKLPNLQRLAETGTLCELDTTYPAMSPVAWSSFATGVNPGKHGIFDFLTRDAKSYQPDLSSADVAPPRRHLKIGNYQLPLGRPQLRLLRKSRPFWQLLSRYSVPCSVLRVPITFPPEKFDGTLLSAMCVPDLQGTQGSFSYYSTAGDTGEAVGGRRFPLAAKDGRVSGYLEGPPNPLRRDGKTTRLPFSIARGRGADRASLRLGRRTISLSLGEYTDWLPVGFPVAPGIKLRGICRFRLLELEPHIRVYVTPVNIDPENPILPISHPKFFAIFLAKLCGRYATLGLAEDTWALNEGVLDEEAFLEQAWANHAEREAMFFEMLRRTPRGVITCVFDGTDRIQHMFMRYLDADHPAPKSKASQYGAVIEDTYRRMDHMVGRVLEKVDVLDEGNLVAVLSDHGFQSFRRGVNLNSWLARSGYLCLEQGLTRSGEWFEGVDWPRTRAFAIGLGGIFLNVRGREAHGAVDPADAPGLADEIAARLTGLVDPERREVAIRRAYPTRALYRGPYSDEAPDILVGYAAGWRASWEGVRGIVDGTVFCDNTKAWSGDHCIDPQLVPGVLICNRPLGGEGRPAISDIAPTILDLFGIPAPRYMDGKSLAPA